MTEKRDAREELRRSVDALAYRTNLYAQMQKDPMKLIGGASGLGLLLGLLVGRRFPRTRTVYLRPDMSPREQKAYTKAQMRLYKAQQKASKGGIGGALTAAVMTIAVKVLQERVLAPQIERLADQLNQKAEQARQPSATTVRIESDPRRPM
ncbi:hypothetical protein [Deinococcus peraridilitoris]|uniref:hypothetical protein n=1 Tax=Deinococcus peraridilitoris TaxID=432329 RepID=UPI0003040493|nr:hypothetical protein [Deinococcus peraridilitoris]